MMIKVVLLAIVAIGYVQAGEKSMGYFKSAGIITDLLPEAPPKEMKVKFDSVSAKYGNSLTLDGVSTEPYTSWKYPNDYPEDALIEYFTLAIVDVDYEGSDEGTGYALFLANNICADNTKGDIRLKYKAPTSSDNHRIAVIVYYQDAAIDTSSTMSRKSFDLAAFAEENAFTVWAGNFYYTSA